jgi:hypothetical protein
MAYIATGSGQLNTEDVKNGDLVRGQHLQFTATSDGVVLIVVTVITEEF